MGESTTYQESDLEICETVIPSDRKVDSPRGDRRLYYVTKLLR